MRTIHPQPLKYSFLDTETGGLKPEKNGLCSIALISPEGNAFYTLIKPRRDMIYTEEAMAVNGLSMERLETEGVPEGEAIASAMEFLGTQCRGSYITGVNVKFDTGFLEAAAARSGCDGGKFYGGHRKTCEVQTQALVAHEMGVITLPRAKNDPEMVNISLDAIIGSLGIKQREGAHDALEDAQITKKAFFEIKRRIQDAVTRRDEDDGGFGLVRPSPNFGLGRGNANEGLSR